MNASYRNDLWGLITGQMQNNFLSQYPDGIREAFDSSDVFNMYFKSQVNNSKNLRFNIEAVPITNPILIDAKNSVEPNEAAYKPFGRSYQMGDSNGMPIYFDALCEDMDRQNETLGRIEAVVELDTTDFTIETGSTTGFSFIPRPNDKVRLFGVDYYVSSLIHTYTSTRKITQLNLSKTPYKIADVIGVDYQFNSVKIPTQNVIDRPLYYEITNSNLYNYLANYNYQYFARLITTVDLAKRVVISKDSSDNYYLYFEAIDNYSFDKGIENSDVVTDVAYSNSEGKITRLSLQIYVVNSLAYNDSMKLPDASAITGASTYFVVATNKYVYKDTRERLTFTIKVKNPN